VTAPADDFAIREMAGCTVVTVLADLDIGTVDAFKDLVGEAIAAGRPVVVDMTACAYADSTGLRAIAKTHAGGPAGSGLVVAPKGTVRRLFAITGFDVALAPFETLDAALQHAAEKGPAA